VPLPQRDRQVDERLRRLRRRHRGTGSAVQAREQFLQYCSGQDISAATVAKKVKHLKRVFQLAEDRGQLDRHPLRKLKPPKAPDARFACSPTKNVADCAWPPAVRRERPSRPMGASHPYVPGCRHAARRADEHYVARCRFCQHDGRCVTEGWPPGYVGMAHQGYRPSNASSNSRVGEAAGRTPDVPARRQSVCLCPMARYEQIQELRRTGQWPVEKGRSPLSKFCHHFNKIRARAGIMSGTFHDLRRTCLSN